MKVQQVAAIESPLADPPKRLDGVKAAVNAKPSPLHQPVTGKVKAAIEAMVWEGLPYDKAAAKAGLHIRSMRLAMAKPHVMAFMQAEKQVLRSSAGPRNIHRLMEIRDAANNMPAVQAIRDLEQMPDERGSDRQQRNPGVVIVIQSNQPANTGVIDITPIDLSET